MLLALFPFGRCLQESIPSCISHRLCRVMIGSGSAVQLTASAAVHGDTRTLLGGDHSLPLPCARSPDRVQLAVQHRQRRLRRSRVRSARGLRNTPEGSTEETGRGAKRDFSRTVDHSQQYSRGTYRDWKLTLWRIYGIYMGGDISANQTRRRKRVVHSSSNGSAAEDSAI